MRVPFGLDVQIGVVDEIARFREGIHFGEGK